MKRRYTWSLVIALLMEATPIFAQLRLVPGSEVQRVFSGPARPLSLLFSNASVIPVEVDLSARLVQVATMIAAEFPEQPAKQFQVLSKQTIRESVLLDIPEVNAATRFLVQWIKGRSNVVGVTELIVYPTNLLMELKLLAGDVAFGVFDPSDELKPLLRRLKLDFQDLQISGTGKFAGRLAIVGPFAEKSQMRAELRDDIRAMANRGVTVVWLPLSPKDEARLKPSFYLVREGEGMVLVAPGHLVAQLAVRPEAQLNLLQLVREALHPTLLDLPETETSN